MRSVTLCLMFALLLPEFSKAEPRPGESRLPARGGDGWLSIEPSPDVELQKIRFYRDIRRSCGGGSSGREQACAVREHATPDVCDSDRGVAIRGAEEMEKIYGGWRDRCEGSVGACSGCCWRDGQCLRTGVLRQVMVWYDQSLRLYCAYARQLCAYHCYPRGE